MCSTLCISLLAYLGAYEPTRFLMGHHRHEWFAGTAGEYHPAQYSTIAGQLGKWWSVFKGLMNFWQENHPMPELDLHLWTIHHEFRASMHLYIALVSRHASVWSKFPLKLSNHSLYEYLLTATFFTI